MSIRSVLKRLTEDILWDIRDTTNPQTIEYSVGQVSQVVPMMLHGKAGVRNGTIVVSDPENDGSYATIVVPDNPKIKVLVNGVQAHGEVVVTESHDIKVKFSDIKPVVTYEASVSADQLSVVVKASVSKGVKLSLRDSQPRRRLVLDIQATHLDPEPTKSETILNLIRGNRYHGIIDYDAINRLCCTTDDLELVVVRGVPPTKGRDTKFRISASYRTELDSVFKTCRCATVPIGTTVAVLEPGFDGVPGKTVYGTTILYQDSEMRLPDIGSGVINVNGNIVAICEGRLRFTKQVIDVVPELVLDRDLTKQDGELQFSGNVIVRGSVLNGAIVRASGTVTVYGNVVRASVFGEKGVFVLKNIYESTVVSGYQQTVYQRLLSYLERTLSELSRFGDEYTLMVTRAMKRFDAYVVIPTIPELLFKNRHIELEQLLGIIVDDYSDDLTEIDSEYRDLKHVLLSTWSADKRSGISQQDIDLLIKKVVSYNERIKALPTELPVIKAANIEGSVIRSAGNIISLGSCYSSTLESGNTLSVSKNLRGGFATAHKSVHVAEFGTPSGLESSLKVIHPDGFIRIALNHVNTLLEVSGRRYRSHETEHDIVFKGVE